MNLDDLNTLLEGWPKHDSDGDPTTLYMFHGGQLKPAKLVRVGDGDLLAVPESAPVAQATMPEKDSAPEPEAAPEAPLG